MTVFLALVLSILIPFNGIFVDLTRYDTSVSILSRNVEDASMSVLADYNGRLYDEYGLYALYETDKKEIRNKVMKYIKLNMESENETGIFQNEIIELNCEYSGFTLDRLKKQIIDYVKYRVPVSLVRDLIVKVTAIADTDFINNTQDVETQVSKCEDRAIELCKNYNDAVLKLNRFPDDFDGATLKKAKSIAEEYLSYNDMVKDALEELYSSGTDIQSKLKDLELKLEQYGKDKPNQSLYIKELQNRIDKLKEKLAGREFFLKNSANTDKNRKLLVIITGYKVSDQETEEETNQSLKNIAKDFIPIEILNSKTPEYTSGDEKHDTRKASMETLRKIFSGGDDDKSKIISEEQKKNLPSYRLKQGDKPGKIKYDFENIDMEDEYFSKESLSSADNLFSKINLKNAYEEILINEYIISTFKSAVLKNHENKYHSDLKGRTLASKNTFLDNEVEYIINGGSRDSDNLFIVKAELFFFRFCMNTLHVYMDPEKKALAEGTALAVTSLLGGAGSSFTANLILWGWSIGESCIDISDLMKGRKVPIYKNRNEWKLDIGLAKQDDSKSSFSIGYGDYLRILLLTVPMEVKLARIADLIQLNTSLWMSGFNFLEAVTSIKTKACFTEKILFPFLVLYPGKILHDERRFKIYVEKFCEYI